MAAENRAPNLSVFLCFLICFFCAVLSSGSGRGRVLAQSSFACDVASNPALARFGFCNKSLKVNERIQDLLSRLNLQQKVGFLVSGSKAVPALGIPKYEWWSEALHGVSYTGPGTNFRGLVSRATSFPQVILTAASFNTTLFKAIGKVVSTEARAMYNVGQAGLTFWSPNVNIFRDPRWGRGQETPGEDPMLSSKYAVNYVQGLQETDSGDAERLKVAACCKHYTAYDLDNWNGVDRFHFDAIVTAQDLDDTYQPPFKSCVVEGNVASVMCSYNKVNGKPTCADPDLLKGVVRGEWNLTGYIVSDCDSVEVLFNSQHYANTSEQAAAMSISAGLDLNCGSFLGEHTEAAVKGGILNESAVDAAISNNFATLMRLGFFDGPPTGQLYGNLGPKDVCTQEHQELAREAARQGIVLLKNDDHALPLSNTTVKSLAVIGPNANVTKTMIGNYEGTPCKYTTPLQGLSAMVSPTYAAGCSDVSCATAQLADATQAAAAADAAVLVMGLDQSIEAESRDRTHISLPGQQELLVTKVAEASKGPVILVIMSGGGVDITFAKNNTKIGAILWVGYPGEAGGAALADVIFGFHNPSGRLPMTWYPERYVEKVPMTNMNMRPDPANDYPGRTYRFYTGETVFAFGDGMSYSEYNHTLVKAPALVSIPLQEKHPCLSTSCQSLDVLDSTSCESLAFHLHLLVTNVGANHGQHTVLLFSSPPAVHNSPTKNLLAFEKLSLAPQQTAAVRFQLDVCKHLGVTDELGNRKIALGQHILHVGNQKHYLTVGV